MSAQKISVIISTYNAEEWLEKVLWGYRVQTFKNFEVVIADDGSKPSTKALIDRFKEDYPVEILHFWHEDEGYRRQKILNEAIVGCSGDYIIMTDGDCIPKSDFVAVHAKHLTPGRFLSGGYCKLSMDLSKKITKEDILSGKCFDYKWLKSHENLGLSNTLKLASSGKIEDLLDTFTPTNATFNNCNSSAWKKDLLAINGYDERMQYGGPDRELGKRLMNMGVMGIQIRHKAICLHLDHARGYKNQESLDRNLAIRKYTKDHKVIKTPFGIEKLNTTA